MRRPRNVTVLSLFAYAGRMSEAQRDQMAPDLRLVSDVADTRAKPTADGDVIDPEDAPHGDWFPPEKAAARLGMSVRNMNRRIADGKYLRRKVRGLSEVFVPGDDTSEVADSRDMALEAPSVDGQLVMAVVRELQADRQAMLDLTARQEARLDALHADLRAAAAREAVLEAENRRLLAVQPVSWWKKLLG
jgi:hypothetical protein